MDKKTLFLKSLAAGHARSKAWLLHTLSIKQKAPFRYEMEGLTIDGDGKKILFHFEDSVEQADWWQPDTSLFNYREPLSLNKGDVINVQSPVKTTYGRVLLNQLIIVENLSDFIEYEDGNWLKDGIINKVMDITATDERVTAEQAHNVVNATQFITGLTQICVPSASEKALGTDPAIKKRLKELLIEHKDDLDNPVVVSKIEQELIGMDKAWLKGDATEGFYKSGKAFNIARKRMHIMHGGEKDFLDATKMSTIPNSLSDGWDMDSLPLLVNALRDGAYSRGTATALGGEKVKKFQQVFQNARVAIPDCKTKTGAALKITAYNYKQFVGRFMVSGTTVKELTLDMLKGFIGKTITIRSPIYCKAPLTDYCEVCSGKAVSKNPNAISMLAATIGSTFMLISMAAAHGKELLTVEYNPMDQLT